MKVREIQAQRVSLANNLHGKCLVDTTDGAGFTEYELDLEAGYSGSLSSPFDGCDHVYFCLSGQANVLALGEKMKLQENAVIAASAHVSLHLDVNAPTRLCAVFCPTKSPWKKVIYRTQDSLLGSDSELESETGHVRHYLMQRDGFAVGIAASTFFQDKNVQVKSQGQGVSNYFLRGSGTITYAEGGSSCPIVPGTLVLAEKDEQYSFSVSEESGSITVFSPNNDVVDQSLGSAGASDQ